MDLDSVEENINSGAISSSIQLSTEHSILEFIEKENSEYDEDIVPEETKEPNSESSMTEVCNVIEDNSLKNIISVGGSTNNADHSFRSVSAVESVESQIPTEVEIRETKSLGDCNSSTANTPSVLVDASLQDKYHDTESAKHLNHKEKSESSVSAEKPVESHLLCDFNTNIQVVPSDKSIESNKSENDNSVSCSSVNEISPLINVTKSEESSVVESTQETVTKSGNSSLLEKPKEAVVSSDKEISSKDKKCEREEEETCAKKPKLFQSESCEIVIKPKGESHKVAANNHLPSSYGSCFSENEKDNFIKDESTLKSSEFVFELGSEPSVKPYPSDENPVQGLNTSALSLTETNTTQVVKSHLTFPYDHETYFTICPVPTTSCHSSFYSNCQLKTSLYDPYNLCSLKKYNFDPSDDIAQRLSSSENSFGSKSIYTLASCLSDRKVHLTCGSDYGSEVNHLEQLSSLSYNPTAPLSFPTCNSSAKYLQENNILRYACDKNIAMGSRNSVSVHFEDNISAGRSNGPCFENKEDTFLSEFPPDRSDGSDSGLGSEIVDERINIKTESLSSDELDNNAVAKSSSSVIDLQGVPSTSKQHRVIKSSLKRSSLEDSAESKPKRIKRSIEFENVSIFYFPRTQGFICVPSQVRK